MNKDIDEIFANYLNHEPLTDEDEQALEEWKQTSVGNRKFGEMVQKLERQKKILNNHQDQKIVFDKIQRHISPERRKNWFRSWMFYAAGLVLLVGVGSFLKWNLAEETTTPGKICMSGLADSQSAVELILPSGEKQILDSKTNTVIVSDSAGQMKTNKKTLVVKANKIKKREPKFYTMNVPLGGGFNVQLSDGTVIYLNAGTTLRYPDEFVGKKREVFLIGEAYFEVAPDSLRPFVVHAADVTVKVLGTAFNINAYPEGAWVKTTLVQGRVETQCGNKKFVMTPGTQVAYNKETQDAKYFPVDIKYYTSWKDGYYDFEEMSLEELMQIFSRCYNVKIEFEDPELKEVKFSGRLKRYEDVKPLFDMLEYIRDVKVIMEDDRIIIRKK